MHHGMGESKCHVCGQPMSHMCCAGRGMGHKGMKGMFMMPWKMMMLKEELGLSDEQVDSIRDKYTNMRKKKIQLKSEIQLQKIDLENMLMQEEVNMPKVEETFKELANLKAQKHITWVQAMQDMRNVLTKEQRDKIKSMIMSFWKESGSSGEEEEEAESGESPEE